MTTTTHHPAIKTIGRDLADGTYLVIEAQLSEHGFVITAMGYERHGKVSGRHYAKTIARDCDFVGMCHDQILEAAPELAPLVKCHLSALDGTPMHALANAWYFYSDGHLAYELEHYGQDYIDRHGTGRERAARTLRVEEAELPHGLDREGFEGYVSSLWERWLDEAKQAALCFVEINDKEGLA